MKPVVLIIPAILVSSGLACFLLLPLSWPMRAGILAADILTAAILAVVLSRRTS